MLSLGRIGPKTTLNALLYADKINTLHFYIFGVVGLGLMGFSLVGFGLMSFDLVGFGLVGCTP